MSEGILRDKYIEPPFSVLDTKQKSWMDRKKKWLDLGIQSELGRDAKTFGSFSVSRGKSDRFEKKRTSTFNPALCEVVYHWFSDKGDKILDPFAGGSVRGIVANMMDRHYTGIELRTEQVASNIEQADQIIPSGVEKPVWHTGDSAEILPTLDSKYDLIFSCPPYGNMEKYSDLEGDISNMTYPKFLASYRDIIQKSCKLLKFGGFAAFVVGEFRDNKGNYVGFVPDTIQAFRDAGLDFYNDAVILDPLGNAAMRAGGNMKSGKLVKVHQNLLVFRKL